MVLKCLLKVERYNLAYSVFRQRRESVQMLTRGPVIGRKEEQRDVVTYVLGLLKKFDFEAFFHIWFLNCYWLCSLNTEYPYLDMQDSILPSMVISCSCCSGKILIACSCDSPWPSCMAIIFCKWWSFVF